MDGGPDVPHAADPEASPDAPTGAGPSGAPADITETAESTETAVTSDAAVTSDVADKDAEAGGSTGSTMAGGADGGGTAPRKPRRVLVLVAVAAFALALDAISKYLVVRNLSDRGPVHVPGGFLNLTLYRNSGAAFSIGEGQTWVFTIIAAVVVVVILRVSRHLRSLPWACALGLLLGGALGNLADRIFREPGLFRGHVVDFLQFPTFPIVHYDFPVFNLADSSIVVGGCLMVLLSFLGIQPDGTRHREEKPEPPDGSGTESGTE